MSNAPSHPTTTTRTSGHTVTGTIEGATREAVEAEAVSYKESYHPMGYGTTFCEAQPVGTGWRMTGHRSTHCD